MAKKKQRVVPKAQAKAQARAEAQVGVKTAPGGGDDQGELIRLAAEAGISVTKARSRADAERLDTAKKAYVAYRAAVVRDISNEVGEIPPIKHVGMRRRMLADPEYYLTAAFPDIFTDPFGSVQKDSIAQEAAILCRGSGRINKLEPRGYGKTIRSACLAVWACLKQVQSFVPICAANESKSAVILEIVLHALTSNDILLSCFPELICFHKLAGNSHKARYQTYLGEKTGIGILGSKIVGPAAGRYKKEPFMIAAIPFQSTRGILTGKGRRPTAVILDDIQTTESAHSQTSIEANRRILGTDIAFLGTRKRPVAIINNATIIAPDDFPHSLTKNRSFVTVRYKMVTDMPTEKEKWEIYRGIRQDYDGSVLGDRDRCLKLALEYYQANREVMDAGSTVTWDHAFSPINHQISTIQAAMDIIYDEGELSFRSECQNDPIDERAQDAEFLNVSQIAAKVHSSGINEVPLECETIKAFIDVQKEMFFYAIWGFSLRFDGFCINYGTFPKQTSRLYAKHSIGNTLTRTYPAMGLEGRLYKGLLDLTEVLFNLRFKRKGDSADMSISRIGIDSRFKTETVRRAYRDSKHQDKITLCAGAGYGVNKRPLRERPLKTGDRKGPNWFYGSAQKAAVRTCEVDTHSWKTFIQLRLATAINDPGSFSLFNEHPQYHRLFAEHLTAEYREQKEGVYGKVDEWFVRPGNNDNDFLDCTVGAAVIASFDGISMIGSDTRAGGGDRRKVNLSNWGAQR